MNDMEKQIKINRKENKERKEMKEKRNDYNLNTQRGMLPEHFENDGILKVNIFIKAIDLITKEKRIE